MIYFGKRFGWFNGSKTNIFARIFRVPHPLTPDPNVPPLRRMPCRSSLGALLPLDFTSDPPKDALPPLCIISLPSLLRVPSRTTLRYAPPFSRTERYAAHVLPLGLTVAFQFTSRALQGTFLPLHSTCRPSHRGQDALSLSTCDPSQNLFATVRSTPLQEAASCCPPQNGLAALYAAVPKTFCSHLLLPGRPEVNMESQVDSACLYILNVQLLALLMF